MHILVCGVAGFIGAKVADLLLGDGHTVTGLDNLNDAYDVRLKHWRLAQLQNRPGFAFQCLDVCHLDALSPLFDSTKFDGVINLAARAGVRQSTVDPWSYFETNVTGTLNLLELCRTSGTHKFVMASSSSVYGCGNAIPYDEDADTDHPISPYAASKKAAETLCYTYHHLYGLDVTVFRYFSVYGPAGRPDMMPFRFVQWITERRPVVVFGDGRQARDFTYIDDIARGTVAGLACSGYQTINLGSDHPVVLLDAVKVIEELTAKTALLEFRSAQATDVPATWAKVDRAERILGWKPTFGFRQGMTQLVNWYLENREWASEIATR